MSAYHESTRDRIASGVLSQVLDEEAYYNDPYVQKGSSTHYPEWCRAEMDGNPAACTRCLRLWMGKQVCHNGRHCVRQSHTCPIVGDLARREFEDEKAFIREILVGLGLESKLPKLLEFGIRSTYDLVSIEFRHADALGMTKAEILKLFDSGWCT